MINEKGYQAIVAEATRVGWPTDHKDDLFIHDFAKLLSDNAPSTFGWVLREMGTDLFIPPMRHSYRWERAYMRNHEDAHWYWYNGEELQEVLPEVLFELLAGGK